MKSRQLAGRLPMSSKYLWFITEAQGERLWDSEICYDVVMGKNVRYKMDTIYDTYGGAEFARKEGGNCKERNIQGKAPQFASV